MGEAWKGLGLALGGGLIYLLLDLLVLRHNATFQKGSKLFRIGFGVLWLGVCLGSYSWVYFARANSDLTMKTLWASYAVRGAGVLVLLGGLVKMGKKN